MLLDSKCLVLLEELKTGVSNSLAAVFTAMIFEPLEPLVLLVRLEMRIGLPSSLIATLPSSKFY